MYYEKTLFNFPPSYTEDLSKKLVSDFEESLESLDIDITPGGHLIAKKSFQSFLLKNGWSTNVPIGASRRQIFGQKKDITIFFNSGPPGMTVEQLLKINAMKKIEFIQASIFVFLLKADKEKISSQTMAYYEKFIYDFNDIYKFSFDLPLVVYGVGAEEY